jgi:peroxiredoxin
MIIRVLLATWALLGLCVAAGAQGPERGADIGRKSSNLSFTFLDGKSTSLYDLGRGKKAVVVLFLTFDCPVSTSYLAEVTELVEKYKDTAFVGVCTAAEQPADIARLEYQVGFPIAHDPKQSVAAALKASTTPEAVVLDEQFVVRYRGRVDDAWAARLKRNKEVTRHDLVEAIEEVRAGREVTQPVTTAIGCLILYEKARPASTRLTYYKDVLPIMQKHCHVCHRPREMGPFSLMTYAQAVNWAADIKEYTHKRLMPPWKPTVSIAMHGERRMTDGDIATLAAWVDGGTPEGNRADAPPLATFGDGWLLGEPDLVLSPKEELTLGASGPDHYRVYVFPLNLPEDRFISGFEVRPGNRRAVHHTIHFLDLGGRARKLEQREQSRPRRADDKDFGPGYPSRMGIGFFPPDGDCGGWAPGMTPRFFPDGVGYYVPKGADFIAHVHYHRTGKVEKDRIQIGLHFAKKPCKPLQPMVIGGLFLSVPPNEEDYAVKGSIWAAQDCTLYTVMPHMHLLGKKIKMTMTPPDGPTTTLVGIDDWDFNWQEIYFLKEPLHVKARTRFDVEGVFDNSSANPRNPFSPPRRVYVGESTTNEMCFGFLGATSDEPGAIGWRLWPGGLTMRRLGALPK